MPSPELFFDTMFAPQRAAAVKAAIELDVFSAIADGAHTVSEIAGRCKASERGIRILCDTLTISGFLTKSGDTYQTTADSAMFLAKQSPAYLASVAEFLLSPEYLRYYDTLADTIRRGTVGPDANSVAPENPIWIRFARAMMPMMMGAAHAIAEILGPTAAPIRVLDIAAGHGGFGLVVAQRNPAAEVVAVDWAPVLTVAAENAVAMGVAARFRTLPGDALTIEYPSGFDVALLANFLHHFDRAACVALLRKVAASLKSGGRVVLLEFVPNEDRISPPLAAAFSLTMLAGTPAGDAYTFAEHKSMLTEAGFTGVTGHPLPGPETVIVGVK
jgi:ubiquinone/menaquinone biosynthesis C-methylase UbiE